MCCGSKRSLWERWNSLFGGVACCAAGSQAALTPYFEGQELKAGQSTLCDD